MSMKGASCRQLVDRPAHELLQLAINNLNNALIIRMLQWLQGVGLRDCIGNEEVRKATAFRPITTHLMQKRLRWYGHVRHRDDSDMTRTVLDM